MVLSTMSKVQLNIWTAISVVVGCVIGSGVFVKPGRVLLAAGDSRWAIAAWLFGGVLTLAGGLTMSELAARIPRSGGVYAYMEEVYGRSWGFVCGWVQAVIYGPGLMSALSLYFGTLLAQFLSLEGHMALPLALIALFILSSISAVSVRGSAAIQNFTTVIKLLPIFLIGLSGLIWGAEPIFAKLQIPEGRTDLMSAGFGVAVLSTLWAYDGWAGVANIAGEIKNPEKNLPRAIVIGILLVMTAYLLVNLSLFHVLPKFEIVELNEKAAGRAAEILFGAQGGLLVSFGILISVMGSLNGNILAMTRVASAMAVRKMFPLHTVFAQSHARFGTPVNSVVLKTVIAGAMVVALKPDRITDIAIFSMYLFYAATFFGLFIVRARIKGKDTYRGYQVPLYPVVPILGGVGSLFICWSMAEASPIDAGVSVAIAALGFPIYFLMNHFSGKKA